MAQTFICCVCGATTNLSKPKAVDKGWNFIEVSQPFKGTRAWCPNELQETINNSLKEFFEKKSGLWYLRQSKLTEVSHA